MIKTFRLPMGYKLVVDTSQVYPEDPGAGTPALVHAPGGRHTGTMFCVIDAGECDGMPVPEAVRRALEDLWEQVDELLASS